jgi:hypothetical protein
MQVAVERIRSSGPGLNSTLDSLSVSARSSEGHPLIGVTVLDVVEIKLHDLLARAACRCSSHPA